MTHEELYREIISKAAEFGFVPKNMDGQPENPRGNSIIRKYISADAFAKGGAYIGFIRPEQEFAGVYSDYSFVVFPDKDMTALLVGLVVGSGGFQNDYELSSMPGLRRQFVKLNQESGKTFFKDDFQDKDSTFSRLVKMVRQDYPDLSASVEAYKNVIVACEILEFSPEDTTESVSMQRVFAWLASYARIRELGTLKDRREQERYLPSAQRRDDDNLKIEELLSTRKYVVLQGAPGTGKTYTALRIARKYDKVFFDQFHAETTYSDFIGGLMPVVDPKAETDFKLNDGILTQAIKYARNHSHQKVLLIIDEINRANLANVLGPVFYLFEPSAKRETDLVNVEINVNGELLTSMPDNIDVIATMNTADRSLAVVDFALRRRFGWYTLRPRILSKRELGERKFDEKLFNSINEIFEKYASDGELALQPGQSYFIFNPGDGEQQRQDKIEYELMPLIKEYLTEGYLTKARTEFSELFLSYGCRMYE